MMVPFSVVLERIELVTNTFQCKLEWVEGKIDHLLGENHSLETQINDLQSENNSLKTQVNHLQSEVTTLKAKAKGR